MPVKAKKTLPKVRGIWCLALRIVMRSLLEGRVGKRLCGKLMQKSHFLLGLQKRLCCVVKQIFFIYLFFNNNKACRITDLCSIKKYKSQCPYFLLVYLSIRFSFKSADCGKHLPFFLFSSCRSSQQTTCSHPLNYDWFFEKQRLKREDSSVCLFALLLYELGPFSKAE